MHFLDIFPQLQGNLSDYKAHFATETEDDIPLQVFLQGNFEDWQAYQTKQNFKRKYILAFVQFDEHEWLFAGVFNSRGCEWNETVNRYIYDTELLEMNTELIGRLIIRYEKMYRQPYPFLENCINDFHISQILKTTYSIAEFPGYENLIIDYDYLQTVIRKREATWMTALTNVKGVYLVTDRTNGKHYVGAAYGEQAFWARWVHYADNGHGGDIELQEIIENKGSEYARNFQFSILEIRSYTTDDAEIIQREQYWKNVLLTREYGYNQN